MAKPAVRALLKMLLDRGDQDNYEHFKFIMSVFVEEIASVEELARDLDTPIPNIKRWASGEVKPPAVGLIYRFLAEMLNEPERYCCQK